VYLKYNNRYITNINFNLASYFASPKKVTCYHKFNIMLTFAECFLIAAVGRALSILIFK